MGIRVELTVHDPMFEIATRIRQGLLEAGAMVLVASDAKAPTEPDPRHGEHMTETGFVRPEVTANPLNSRVAIGYTAFWAVWQHEDTDYDHPHGGEDKFLERALIELKAAAMDRIAARVRAGK